MALTADQRSAQASIAARTRHRPDDDALHDDRREWRAEVLADHVRRVVDAAPPLTQAQRDRVAAALGRGPDATGAPDA